VLVGELWMQPPKIPVFFSTEKILPDFSGVWAKKTNWVQKDLLQSKNSGAKIKREANA
jgi:hypothetical protein